MKKYFLPIITIFSLSVFSIGCNLAIQDKDLLDRPEVEIISSGTGVGITISRYSQDTKYINIYRRDVTTSTEADAITENVGLLFPDAYKKEDKTYLFVDTLVFQDHKYEYQLRYKEADISYYTNWTAPLTIPISKGYLDSKKLEYSKSTSAEVSFTYNSTDYNLKINGTLSNPEITGYATDFIPMLAVSIPEEKVTQVFKITSVADKTVINLRSLLPPDFLDKQIKIEGLLGQQIIYAPAEAGSTIQKEQMIIWTKIMNPKFSGYSDHVIPSIPADASSDGYDFS